MDRIDQLLAVKTRLTTIKGYAQLLEREIERTQPCSDRLAARIEELNREIMRLVELIVTIEASMTDRENVTQSDLHSDSGSYQSSGC